MNYYTFQQKNNKDAGQTAQIGRLVCALVCMQQNLMSSRDEALNEYHASQYIGKEHNGFVLFIIIIYGLCKFK